MPSFPTFTPSTAIFPALTLERVVSLACHSSIFPDVVIDVAEATHNVGVTSVGDIKFAFRLRAVCCAVDTGLFTSLVSSTLVSQTIALVIHPTVPVNVGEARLAFRFKESCVAVDIGFNKSVVLSTFHNQTSHFTIPVGATRAGEVDLTIAPVPVTVLFFNSLPVTQSNNAGTQSVEEAGHNTSQLQADNIFQAQSFLT